jgi:hypothetical protein
MANISHTANPHIGTTSPRMVWAGRILSGLVILFMIFDGVIKLPPLDVVPQSMAQLGWPTDVGTARLLGIISLAAAALYAWPRTAFLGAISHTFFGVYLGIIMWGGLWFRDARLRALLPFSR